MSDTATLAPGTLFSQHSLNTYWRCPRRYLLRYVERLPWPMPEEEDPRAYQESLRRGRVLHQWLARAQLGLEMAPIVAASGDAQLAAWWAAAKAFDREALPGRQREAELAVVVPLGDYRLYARYDLLALDPGGKGADPEAMIVDWKTLESVPPYRTLQRRWQTRVYLYSLVRAGHVLTGGAPIDPSRASLLYWFANYPDETVTIPYSAAAHARDHADLLAMVERIATQPREAFALTDDARLCARCTYRTLCGRADAATLTDELAWLDEDLDESLDLDAVPEIDY